MKPLTSSQGLTMPDKSEGENLDLKNKVMKPSGRELPSHATLHRSMLIQPGTCVPNCRHLLTLGPLLTLWRRIPVHGCVSNSNRMHSKQSRPNEISLQKAHGSRGRIPVTQSLRGGGLGEPQRAHSVRHPDGTLFCAFPTSTPGVREKREEALIT